jgi:hypothetical protein
MKLETAIKTLLKEVEFLGYKNLGELADDIDKNPLAFPQAVMTAFRVYRDAAYR